jgi:iron complex outermembrane receptor protein
MQFSTKLLGFSLLAGCSLFGNAELEPMVISALRLETETKNLPARVQVIDFEKIEQSGSTDLVGLLRKEANLQVRSTSGNSARSTVSMGGFGDNGDGRTLVLLDGHRLNAFDLYPINWHSIPLAMLESIEVIRGAHSGSYGNHAVGGVIKLNTKKPLEKPSASFEASLGSFDTLNTRGYYSQILGEFGVTLFGERAESDGYRVNGDHQTDAVGARVDWGSESDFRGYFSWSFSDTEFGLPGELTANQLISDTKQTNRPDDRGAQESSHIRAGIHNQLKNGWSMENRLGFEDQQRHATMPSQSGYLEKTDYKTFSYSPTIYFNSEDRDFLFGLDLFNGKLDRNANYIDFDSDASREYRRTSTALFSSIRNSFSENWDLVANLRFQKAVHELTASGSVLNDMQDIDWASGFGVIRKFEDSARVYSSIRRFFRYPSTDELVAFDPPSYLPSNHINLVPENGYEAEVGVDWSLEKALFNARVFRQWMEKEIITDGVTNFNLDDTHRIGVDLAVNWEIANYASAGVSYEYVRAKIVSGTYKNSKIPLVAESLLRFFVELRPTDSWFLKIGSSYVDESFQGNDFFNSGNKIEDYWLSDLSLNYDCFENASLFVNIENLLDENYISTAYRSAWGNPTAFYPGEGRKVTAGLRYSF